LYVPGGYYHMQQLLSCFITHLVGTCYKWLTGTLHFVVAVTSDFFWLSHAYDMCKRYNSFHCNALAYSPACSSVRPFLTTPCSIQSRNCQLFTSCLSGFCFCFLFRPHRSTTYLDAAYCYRRSSEVCRSVCRSVCHSSEPCKKG